jgi:glutamine synthetase adenylyltransferase
MRLFSWNFNEGLLSKLRTYCSLFLQNDDTDEKELIAIQHYAEKIWHHYLQALDALQEVPQDRTQLLTSLDKASSAMHRFAKLIPRLAYHFKHDENVILFLLKNHKILDRLYTNRFVIKLLTKMYPKGIKEVQHFLIEKYSARGFENLLPSIQAAVAELEASSQ